MSVNDYHDGVPVDENGYFNFDLPFCPGEVVLKVRAEGYVSTLKIVDVPPDTLGTLDNIQVVLFELAEPVTVVVGEENILETSGAAIITISDETTFLDKNGNEVRENVNAILNFIDPSNDDFRNSPGRFVTDEGEELVSLGVFNLIFENDVGDSLTPIGNIRIGLADFDDPEYKLWLLDNKGHWVEKIPDPVVEGSQAFGGLASRKKRQTGSTVLGSFGTGDIGQWINLDKVSSASMCYIKARVFDDMSFTSEVVVNGVDNYKPEFLLKIGAGSPFQGLPLYRAPIISPGQTCFEVRCGTTPKTQGIVSVITQETLGNGQSIPFPAIPIPVGHGELPSSLDTELASLNYEVNADKTEAKLDFESSTTGPLYQNQTTCENSALSDNSLWFARRSSVFTNTNFGSDFCYARVPLYQRQNTAPPNELLDQLQATSVWGNGPSFYAEFVAQNSEFVHVASKDFTCIRYRCSELSDLTTIFFQTVVTNVNVTCYTVNITAPILPQPITAPSAPDTAIGTVSTQSKPDRIHRNRRNGYIPNTGYYVGVNEGTVKAECEAESDEMKTAGQVTCSMGMG